MLKALTEGAHWLKDMTERNVLLQVRTEGARQFKVKGAQ